MNFLNIIDIRLPKYRLNHSVKTLVWLIFSNILKSGGQWILLIILVKFFSTEDVGYFNYGLAIAAPIFMFSEMQMKSVLVVESDSDRDFFSTYLIIRVLTATLAMVGLIIYTIYFKNINWIIITVILYKSAESLVDILYGYLQKKDKMVWMSKIDIIKSIMTIIVCFLTTILMHHIVLSIFSIVLVSSIFYIIDMMYIRHKLIDEIEPFSIEMMKEIIKKSLPLGISVFFVSYISNYPKIVIENICGPVSLAYFGAYSYLVIGIFQISAPIQTFLRQRLSKKFHEKKYADFVRLINLSIVGFLSIGLFMFVLFLLFGNDIVVLIYNKDYVELSGIIAYLIIGQLILAISGVYATAVLSFNIYTKQALISGGCFLVVVTLSKFLIEQFGICGGAYIGILASLISLACYLMIYRIQLSRWKKYNSLK